MLSLFFNQFLYKFLSGFFALEFSLFSLLSGVNKELPKAGADFTPVVRFAVCSDAHLDGNDDTDNAKKFKKLFTAAYNYSASQSYNKLDALLAVGDICTSGADEEYIQFKQIISDNLKDETQLLAIIGNHEFIKYRDTDPTVGYAKFKQYMGDQVDRHDVIGGYHFIGVSYSDDAYTFTSKKAWLKAELKKAVADTGDKPIFVYQHPQPFNTVYGSVIWGDFDIRTVLSQFPQVVDFSGHSHYSSTDPRSIWQGEFTAVGTGSVTSLMGNMNYTEGDKDAPGESGTFWIVEADKDGNVRLKLYDLANDRFFDKIEYYLSDVSNLTKRRYTWGNLKSHDTKPEFPGNAEISFAKNDDDTVSLLFPDATCFWEAESYKINITQNGKSVYSTTIISNYVRSVKNGMKVNIGNLDAGSYDITIKAYSPYAKSSKALTGSINISNYK